jgi:hypothetical protein
MLDDAGEWVKQPFVQSISVKISVDRPMAEWSVEFMEAP